MDNVILANQKASKSNRLKSQFIKLQIIYLILAFSLVNLLFPSEIYAQGACYNWSGTPPTIGDYLECMLPRIWTFFQAILAAITLIFLFWFIYKFSTNRNNSEYLEQLPQKSIYLILLIFLTAGLGGLFLDALLKLLGFNNGVQIFINFINTEILDVLKKPIM